MPFDAQLAIASLDFKGFGYADHPDLSVLRARYPDLSFVFDRLEDLQELSDTVDKQIEEAEKELQDEVEGLEQRNSDLRLALNQIRELTVEITNIIEDAL